MSVLLDPGARPVIAHRGASAHAPENTILAFEWAIAAGADALELDVHLSADGRVVVIHDATLERTTDGVGAARTLSVAHIRAADAGANFTRDGRTFPFRGTGVRVPTIEEVLEHFPHVPLLIELKTADAASALSQSLARFGAAARCVIGAFDQAALAPFRAPPWHTAASQVEAQQLLMRVLLRRPLAEPPYRVCSIPPRWRGLPLPMTGIARAARERGVSVHVWVVDDPREAGVLWRRGVHGIISNDPAAIHAARARGA